MGISFRHIKEFTYPLEIIKLRRELSRTETYSREQLEDLQSKKLRCLIRYCYNDVPYYREIFDKNSIKPDDIRSINDLAELPVLTKDIVRERFEDLSSTSSRKHNPYIQQTSGSTGTPLKFYLDKHTSIARFAFYWRLWNWAGYHFGQKWACIKVPIIKDGTLFKYSRLMNALVISSLNLTSENCRKILDELKKFRPKTLRGYPSALYTFAKFMGDELKHLSIDRIVTDSETLLDYQRIFLEETFGCNVHDSYHQWECVCLISECAHKVKHHHMEYGILEILDEDNQPVETDQQGEIVATGLHNLSMPLLRYKTGDLAVRTDTKCNCGRAEDVIGSIDGRIEDVVVTPDGRHVGRLGGSFNDNKGIDFAQIIQDDTSTIKVLLVKNKHFNDGEIPVLEKNLRERLGDSIEIEYEFRDKIEPAPNGKVRLVINNIDMKR